MLPLLLLIPGAYFLWKYAHRHGGHHAGYLPPALRHRRRLHEHRGPIGPRRGLTASDYLRHLHEATMASRVLDSAKSYALAGDIQALMALPDVGTALAVLAAPIDVLFAQKDLNVLGASPSLPEDGILGLETQAAIAGFQSRFGQNATGALDDGTAVAIRYAVGCINAQGI